MSNLITIEGQRVDLSSPLSEHPNPLLRRDNYACLNGKWGFEINQDLDPKSVQYQGSIIVPFAVETQLSSIQRRVQKNDVLHYQKVFDLPKKMNASLVVLHFEAVDQVCDVYLNGERLIHHEGGYIPFAFRCPKLHKKDNVLEVVVIDDTASPYFPRGKQLNKNGGIWYTPTSGIWGSVWLEEVPEDHIEEIRFIPDIKARICKVIAKLNNNKKHCKVEVYDQDELVDKLTLDEDGEGIISLKNMKLWTVESPHLYDVILKYGEDEVHSYFGMREVSTTEHNGHLYPALNGRPIFLSGPLDQGYYPESGLTPPSDQAMINDIMMMKKYGFNMVRKHIKVEPRRWYYHCDRLGLLVMQDFVNIGAPYQLFLIGTAPFIPYRFDDRLKMHQHSFGIKDERTKESFIQNNEAMMRLLINHPSIVAWTIFNEGWGQFDAKAVYEHMKQIDPTRLFDVTSGWYDQGVGNFDSHHVYFRRVLLNPCRSRILSLSEFGGYSLKIDDHTWSNKAFGYKKMKDQADLNAALKRLYEEEIIPLKKVGLAVAVYTQLSDVEDEINGLVTYDRKVEKADPKLFQAIHKELLKL